MLAAAAGPREASALEERRAAGRTSSGWPRARAPLWRPGRARSARRASAAPPPLRETPGQSSSSWTRSLWRGPRASSSSRATAHAGSCRAATSSEAWGNRSSSPSSAPRRGRCRRFRSSRTTCRQRGAQDRLRVHEARPRKARRRAGAVQRAGVGMDDLECGAERGSRLRHSCSKKHAGFLFLCHRRLETGYRVSGTAPAGAPGASAETVVRPAIGLVTAIDGCGVPTFALSLIELAHMFAGFARGRLRVWRRS